MGVRAVLQILLLGVSEVSRFKLQRISLGLVFQFEVWVSIDLKVYLTEDFFQTSISGCQRFRDQFL